MKRIYPIAGLFLVSVMPLPVVAADEHVVVASPDDLKWSAAPPSFPKGAQLAVVSGDPSKEGPWVFRLKFPDGYKIPPHTHPGPERVTVISGTLNLGMGETFDMTKGQEMTAGTYGTWPADMKHFAWAKGETVIQLHGEGPWKIVYLNESDDPRKKK